VAEIELPAHVDQVPVVDARPAYRFLVQPESQRPHQVQNTPGRSTEPRDVSGVRRDLGFDQHDMQRNRERGGAKAGYVVAGHRPNLAHSSRSAASQLRRAKSGVAPSARA
jgi:hypothetical protein